MTKNAIAVGEKKITNFPTLRERFYYQMVLVRFFEKKIYELFEKGALFGTTHAYIGQEANAVGVLNHLREEDVVVSNHRCHGHYLIRTEDCIGLMAELMGKAGGVCGGRGGSQHLQKGNFYTNGVLGSTVPVAAGIAYAEKIKRSGAIGVLFLGDGCFGEGVVYETLNMLSLWKVPLLMVVENNRYAQSTPINLNFSGTFTGRAKAFGIESGELDTNDVEEIYNVMKKVTNDVRQKSMPYVQVLNTYRLCGHSKGDDTRSKEEIASWELKDPIKILGDRIASKQKKKIESMAMQKIDEAYEKAHLMPFPTT